jgi:hypothetical protein
MLLGSRSGFLKAPQISEIEQQPSTGEGSQRERGPRTSSADLVSLAGTHRYTGCLVRCSVCRLAWDPQGSRVHIGPCGPYKHRNLENVSDLCYDALPATDGGRRDSRGKMDHTLGLTPVCVGKDERDKSAQAIQGRRGGRTLENQGGG